MKPVKKKTALLADYLRNMCFIEQLRNTSQPAMSQQKENCASQSTPKRIAKKSSFLVPIDSITTSCPI